MRSWTAIAAPGEDASDGALVWGLTSRQVAMLAGILIVTIAVYLPSLRNGWVYDDRIQILTSYGLHSWSGIESHFSTTVGGSAIRTNCRPAPTIVRCRRHGSA